MFANNVAVAGLRMQSSVTSKGQRRRLLIFSPDADLARSLLLILEDRCEIVRETALQNLETSICKNPPDLILIDLFTFSSDIIKQIDIVRRTAVGVPIIILRAYKTVAPEIDLALEKISDLVFYKPVDVNLVMETIESLL